MEMPVKDLKHYVIVTDHSRRKRWQTFGVLGRQN
jgi:hypothetical protein